MGETVGLGRQIDTLQSELIAAAHQQDAYDLATINLIAPASPTVPEYSDDLPLRHNAIAEGLLGHRPYAGVAGFNRIESIAVAAACSLFRAEHANVQPHSVSQANQAAYQALLHPGDNVLAMRFDAGGHLTHGMAKNFSGQLYNFNFYGLTEEGFIDYKEVERLTEAHEPKMIVCGASSYPRIIEFSKLASIAQSAGAYLLADVSHPAGLIAAERFPQPFPDCDVVTLTLDKTMLGPHGGLILCKEGLKSQIDAAVHPGVQSSVPLRRIYAMAQCMIDAHKPEFRHYIDRVLHNMTAFVEIFNQQPGLVVTGGSDSHLMSLDTFNTFGLTGKQAEELLENMGILTNRQVIPNETLKPYLASGIRLGTSWITARGYTIDECRTIAQAIVDNLADPHNGQLQEQTRLTMQAILRRRHEQDVWSSEPLPSVFFYGD